MVENSNSLNEKETEQQLYDEIRTLGAFDEPEGLELRNGESNSLLEHLVKKNLVERSQFNSQTYHLTTLGEKWYSLFKTDVLKAYREFLFKNNITEAGNRAE